MATPATSSDRTGSCPRGRSETTQPSVEGDTPFAKFGSDTQVDGHGNTRRGNDAADPVADRRQRTDGHLDLHQIEKNGTARSIHRAGFDAGAGMLSARVVVRCVGKPPI